MIRPKLSVYTPQPHTVKPIAETHYLKMEFILTVFFLSLMSECFFSPQCTIHFHIGNYFHLAPKQDLILYFLLTMLSSFILCFELARNCSRYVMHKSKTSYPPSTYIEIHANFLPLLVNTGMKEFLPFCSSFMFHDVLHAIAAFSCYHNPVTKELLF